MKTAALILSTILFSFLAPSPTQANGWEEKHTDLAKQTRRTNAGIKITEVFEHSSHGKISMWGIIEETPEPGTEFSTNR